MVLKKKSSPIGSPGEVVKVNESKFGKSKYNKVRNIDGVWGTRECLIVLVKVHTDDT